MSMSQQREFIPCEQALELKELGFDENVFAIYDIIDENYYKFLFEYKDGDNIFSYQVAAPLYQQAFRWFREKYKMVSFITNRESPDFIGSRFTYWIKDYTLDRIAFCNTYEEAELACLSKLIEIVKNK